MAFESNLESDFIPLVFDIHLEHEVAEIFTCTKTLVSELDNIDVLTLHNRLWCHCIGFP